MAAARKGVSVRTISQRATVLTEVNKVMRRKVAAMGVEARRTLLEEVLVGQRFGREYVIPGTKGKKKYRASRWGEPPATRLGDLRRSYKLSPVHVEAGRISIQLGSQLEYAPILEDEEGLNRQHLEPAIKLASPRLAQILMGEWGI